MNTPPVSASTEHNAPTFDAAALTPRSRAPLPRSIRWAAQGALVFSALGLAGCDHEEVKQETAPPVTCVNDYDCDRIPDPLDRNKYQNDGPDADLDGKRNEHDLLRPYDYDPPTAAIPGPTTIPPIVSRPTNPTILPCMKGFGPDYDKDSKPDRCDWVINDRDSDGDELPDRIDTAPHNADRDRDGIPDGLDREPNVSSYDTQRREDARNEQERQEEQRLEEKRQQEARDRKLQEEKRLEDERRRQQQTDSNFFAPDSGR